MLRRQRDADARIHLHVHRVQRERLLQAARQAPGDRLRALGVRLQQHRRELVAAQSHERVGWPQRSAEALAHVAQDFIARAVAEGVVDLLEAVEVDEQERECGRRRSTRPLREERVEDVKQVAPVAEAGQLVGQRVVLVTVGEAAQAAHRHRQAHAHRRQRCARERRPTRCSRCCRRSAPTSSTDQSRDRREARQQEARRLGQRERVGVAAGDPHGHRHDDYRHRPGDTVDDRTDVRRARGGASRLKVSPTTFSAMPEASSNHGVLRCPTASRCCRRPGSAAAGPRRGRRGWSRPPARYRRSRRRRCGTRTRHTPTPRRGRRPRCRASWGC